MNCLIIGGNRFVGKRLAIKLKSSNNQVTVFNRSGTGHSDVYVIKGDRNIKTHLEQINFNEYDCIIDMCLYNLTQLD